MAGKQVQRRRGTTAQHNVFIGAAGEVTVDTNKHTQVVHDGATPGGHPLATEAAVAAVQADADAAQTTADAAQTTANSALTTANTANAGLANKADLKKSNTFVGNALRFMADFSSGVGALANRFIFQTSTVNAVTNLSVAPNGSGEGAGIQLFANTNLENSPRLFAQVTNSVAQVGVDKNGTGGFLPLQLMTGGLARLGIAATGQVAIQSDVGGYYGQLMLASTDGSSYNRQFRVNNANGLEVISRQSTMITHLFGNDGSFTAYGAIGASGNVSSNVDVTAARNISAAGTVYGASIQSSGSISAANGATIQGDVFASGTVRCSTYTAGGEARIYRIRDTTQATAMFQETEVGVSLACAYLIGNGWRTVGPNNDGATYCGWTLARWATIFAVTGAINTSDQREKNELRPFTPEEIKVAQALAGDIGIYQWLTSIEEKGEADARLHAGLIAQNVQARFEEQGLDPHAYGLFCYDEWEDFPASYGPDGEELTPFRAAGNRYGLRYDELNQFIMRGLAESQRSLEARIAALEGA